MFHCRISLNSVLLLLLVNFVSGFRLELSGFKPQSSPSACAVAIVHKDHFFRLYQKNKSSESKVIRQASNHCKRIFEDAKLTYANKTKEWITSQKLGSLDFL